MEAAVSYLLMPKTYQFKAKDSEIKSYYIPCLGNILKDFTIDNRKKTGLKEAGKVFSVNYNATDTNDILNIHRFNGKKNDMK